jgi:release factor glutamine methyltransferase
MLLFEIGWNQAEDVTNILKENGFSDIHVKQDLAGLDRVVYAQKSIAWIVSNDL